jgi:transposase
MSFVNGNVSGEIFSQFIELNLLPHLLPFNGSNPNSIVVQDNASVHYHERVRELINSVGVLLLFLPPYSPDLNPIEETFSAVKSFLKANEEIASTSRDIENILLAAFGNVTPGDCI